MDASKVIETLDDALHFVRQSKNDFGTHGDVDLENKIKELRADMESKGESDNGGVYIPGHTYDPVCPYCGEIYRVRDTFRGEGRSSMWNGTCRRCGKIFSYIAHCHVTFTSSRYE